jgi:hypothetical protein
MKLPPFASVYLVALLAGTVGPVPQISFVTQVASAFALLIGGPVALRAQRRYAHVNTWRIVTCWGLAGALVAVGYLLLTALA